VQLTAEIRNFFNTKTIEVRGRIINLQPIKTYGQITSDTF